MILETFKKEKFSHFERLLKFRTDKEKRAYVDRLYKSYFYKDGSVNAERVEMDRVILEEFIEDCRDCEEWQYGMERFTLLLQVI